MITADDLTVALSWSGETVELKSVIDYSRRFRSRLVAITAQAGSTLAKAADVALELPQAREACPHNLAPTTCALMQSALGDEHAIALLECRGFTALDFALLHPGGKLGAMLKLARDVMRTGAELPLARPGTRIADAIVEMSAKGFGWVGIVDESASLVGIITDGELRRHMSPKLLDLCVDDVMTPNPDPPRPVGQRSARNPGLGKGRRLDRDEANKPVGILRLHDLLRAGVA